MTLIVVVQVLYMLATVVSLDYLHDTWFYWTHRLLHWQPLYRSVHHIHHQCAFPVLRGCAFLPPSLADEMRSNTRVPECNQVPVQHGCCAM